MFSRRLLNALMLFSVLLSSSLMADWPQAGGPGGDFVIKQNAAINWSMVKDSNIRWQRTLPETGQSIPVIAAGKVFVTTLKPVKQDSELGRDIVAYCLSEETGKVIWTREIKGKHPLRLSGCFSDSSAPPAVCDGKRVVFTNASGGMTCFDLDGNIIWEKDYFTVGRTLPFMNNRNLIYTRQVYPPEPNGNFPHSYKDASKEMWTQLQALDMKTGEIVWTSECGVNMGNAVIPQTRTDGKRVAVVGRGGGHGPPEKPEGISMVDLANGKTLWTLPLVKFMSTQSYGLHGGKVHLFHGGEHLSVDEVTGEIVKRVSILKDVSVRGRKTDGQGYEDRVEAIKDAGKGRMITQTSNLLVGPWNYFRSYTLPYLGRVHVEKGTVEYLELPLQVRRGADGESEFLWHVRPEKKKDPQMKEQVFVPNDMKNSRGLVVFGDKRSKGSGWGHVASAIPSVAGKHLYVPVMNGTVYVIRWDSETLSEKSVVAFNDLGPVGESYNRASLSFANGSAYAHTIKGVICIGR